MKHIAWLCFGTALFCMGTLANAACITDPASYGWNIGQAFCNELIKYTVNQTIIQPAYGAAGLQICSISQAITCKGAMATAVGQYQDAGYSCRNLYYYNYPIGNQSAKQVYSQLQHQCDAQ